jgi:hypothetical protein
MTGVARLLEHTAIEGEPRQFAIDEAAGLSAVIAPASP